MAKFTNDDVDEIVTALQRERGQFAFLMGAGCSLTAGIPGGGKIATDICEKYPHQTNSLSEKDKQNYAICMGRLPIETRKQIINGYLDSPEVKLNWAHIALASLVKQEFFSRVLTFNFDNLLTRACGLLGKYPATYDFGTAPSTQTRHLAKPSIVHLHGQGSGSVLLNTDKETEQHAIALEPLLKDTFANYPTIVMGYSGDSDKVFDKIKTLYKGDQCLYWIGHNEEPSENLAQFIKEIDGSGYCKYIGGADADEFLVQLAQKLNCFPPTVFADPAGHLLDEIKDVAEFPLHKELKNILKDTTKRLNTHREALKFTLEQTAVLQDKPADVITDNKDTDPDIAAWALIRLGDLQYDIAKETKSIAAYNKAAKQYEAAHDIKADSPEALYRWGNALLGSAKLQNKPELFDACFNKFQAAINIKSDMYEVLNNWGFGLSYLAKLQNDHVMFKASFAKYEAALKIKPNLHETLYNWGGALIDARKLNKVEKYIEQAAKVLNRAENLNPDKCYQGARLAAINSDEEGCKKRLFRAKAAKTLPTRKHLKEDEDLANMRNKPWFTELLKDL